MAESVKALVGDPLTGVRILPPESRFCIFCFNFQKVFPFSRFQGMKGNGKPFLHAELESKEQLLLKKFLRSVEYV